MGFRDIFRDEEKAGFALRRLYADHGFRPYKMGRFEEYDYYARNKDFLVSGQVITFTDTNGKLMALKPDVTLSIVKSSSGLKEGIDRVSYDENVYRISDISRRFQEIRQAGLECLGQIDIGCIAEVLSLAAASLRILAERSILTVSHLGILSETVSKLGLGEEDEKKLYKCIAEKNQKGIRELAGEERGKAVSILTETSGKADEVLPVLRSIGCSSTAVEELERLLRILDQNGCGDQVEIDFSVVNDMAYYNGIVFRGYIEGIPFGILSGGQYDKLLEKLGKQGKAIGFAVYLDLLEYLPEENRKNAGTYGLPYNEAGENGGGFR